MGTKKSNKLYAAAAALAVTASAVAPGLSADAATKVTVKSVVNPASISHYGGYANSVKKLSLPKTVKVMLSNKKTENRSVKWGKVAYDAKYVGKYQTITGTVSGTSLKATIKVKLNNYPVDVVEPKLAPVAVGEDVKLPSTITVKYKNGKSIERSIKSFTISKADTSKAGKMKLSYSYKGLNLEIKGSIAYEVKKAEVTNIKGEVKDDMLSVSADVKYPAKDAKAEVLVYPGKDVSKAMPFAAEIKDGKLMAKTTALPAGTHSFAVKVGDVVSPVTEFMVEAPTVKEVKAINVNKLQVTFNKAVEGAKFEVKRSSVTEDVKITWNEAKTIATLEKTGNFVAGDYTVTVTGIENLKDASKTVKVEAEVIKEVSLISSALQKSSTAPLSVEFINQYGEKATISASDSKLSISAFNKTAGTSISRVPNQFQLLASGASLKDEVVVTVMYDGMKATKTLEVVNQATVGKVTLSELVLPSGKTMFTPSGTKDLELKYSAVNSLGDSYKLTATDKTSGAVQFLSSDASILDPSDITIDGDNKIKVAKFGKAGLVTLTAFSPATGETSKITVEVKEDAGAPYAIGLDKTSAQFAAGSTSALYLSPKVTDKYGSEIALKDLNAADYVISSTNTNVAGVSFVTTPGENYGKILVSPQASVTKGQSAIITVIVKATGQQIQATVSASEAAVPTSLALKSGVTAPTNLLVGSSKTLSFDAKDQYGSTIGNTTGYTVDYTTSDATVLEIGAGEAGDALNSSSVSFTAKKAGNATIKAILKKDNVAVAEKVYNINTIANDSSKVSYSVASIDSVYKGVANTALVGGTISTGSLDAGEKQLLVDSGYAEEIKVQATDANGNVVSVPASSIVKVDLTQPSAVDGSLTGALEVFEINGKYYVYTKTGFDAGDFSTASVAAKDIKGKVSFTINADDIVKVVSQDITVSKDDAMAKSVAFKNKSWNALDASEATDVTVGEIANATDYADPSLMTFVWAEDQFGGFTASAPTLSLVNVDGVNGISNDAATISAGNLTIADGSSDTVFTKNNAKFRLVAQAGSQTDFVTFNVVDGVLPTALAHNATTAPNSFKRVSATEITIQFSEALKASTFTADAANGFAVAGAGALTKAVLSADGKTVTLTGTGFTTTTTVAYTVGTVSDASGNLLATIGATATN